MQNFSKMSRVEVSEFTGIPVTTLCFWATMHPDRLPYYKYGKRVWYNRSEVLAFIAASKVGGTE